MPVDYGRIHRLLKVLTLIQGEKGWNAKRLALECGTTERNIYRDLKMLEGAGIPYFFDEVDRCYRIRRDFFLPPVQLTLDESLALATLAEQIGGKEQVPFTQSARRAISKIRGQLPAKVLQEMEQIEDHVSIKLSAASSPEGSSDVYEAIRAAISQRRVLSCRYDSASTGSKNGDATFLLKPYTLLFNQRAWYVIGHHGRHNGIRCLRLSRFNALQPTDQTYDIPKTYSLSKHLGNAWRMIRGAKSYRVELRFDSEFADTIADTQWHPTQEVTWNDDRSITFRCKVDGLEEIVWWILSMGPHCSVTRPKELAQRVKKLAVEVASLYPSA